MEMGLWKAHCFHCFHCSWWAAWCCGPRGLANLAKIRTEVPRSSVRLIWNSHLREGHVFHLQPWPVGWGWWFSLTAPLTRCHLMPYRFLEPSFVWMRTAGKGMWCGETRTITLSEEGMLLRHRNLNPQRTQTTSLLSASLVTAEWIGIGGRERRPQANAQLQVNWEIRLWVESFHPLSSKASHRWTYQVLSKEQPRPTAELLRIWAAQIQTSCSTYFKDE